MKKIVLASGNAGKLREFSAMFANHFSEQAIEVIPQNDFNVTEAEENAAWRLHLHTRLVAKSQIPLHQSSRKTSCT